uniref:ShKT domain-containing protein n=1 Tax=Rhabditophanes sp. KR3021 TaxID=114890 RepID=A0AC35THG5_9BILA
MQFLTVAVLFITITAIHSQTCVDTISNCNAYIPQCRVSSYISLMKEKCCKTCGFGVPTTTKPITPKNPELCLSPSKDLIFCALDETCNVTTGTCNKATGPVVPPKTCRDTATNCTSMKSNGYCTNAAYSKIMREQCTLTCGFC